MAPPTPTTRGNRGTRYLEPTPDPTRIAPAASTVPAHRDPHIREQTGPHDGGPEWRRPCSMCGQWSAPCVIIGERAAGKKSPSMTSARTDVHEKG